MLKIVFLCPPHKEEVASILKVVLYVDMELAGWAGSMQHTHMWESSLGLNLEPSINCYPSISQAECFITVCAVRLSDGRLKGVPSAGISWWTLTRGYDCVVCQCLPSTSEGRSLEFGHVASNN